MRQRGLRTAPAPYGYCEERPSTTCAKAVDGITYCMRQIQTAGWDDAAPGTLVVACGYALDATGTRLISLALEGLDSVPKVGDCRRAVTNDTALPDERAQAVEAVGGLDK